ncbi:ABC transporter substrate-binding protein [Petroclostridium xylanilyticum]|uniref:ABC transporter substrate-binding protein n=1 Tax=Petroclostridium xylanilyticum TaxID=1792311 RepID=UPI000B97E97B|nr:extracellular solute-binding protein [Petroclostridium xylanilyticum]
MRNHKKLAVLGALLVSGIMLTGCNGNVQLKHVEEAKKDSGVRISIYYPKGMTVEGVIEEITANFKNENPDIIVDFNASTTEYENIMKIKMASRDMPDVFGTHGWAVRRYGAFLADLSHEEWAPRVKDSIRPIVTDKNGKLYVLPMDEDRTGPIFNVEILEKYGIKVPATFDQLIAACEAIKEKSNGTIIPMYIDGGNPGGIGNFYDLYSTPLLISPENNYAQEILDGTFDWSKYDLLSEKLLELKNKGLINKDVLTARSSDAIAAFAAGKVAFAGVSNPTIIGEAKKINPDLKAGIMPIPAMVEGDEPTFVGGERTTFGVWKDSPNIEVAKKYVAFLARPENIRKVAEVNRVPAGLTGANEDLGELTPYYEKYRNLRIFPYFDRAYLPSGMWDVMCKNGQDLLAGAITPQQYSQNMKKEFDRLRAQNK